MNKSPLSRAIDLVGLQALARAVGVSYQAIRKFERESLPAERVLSVACATDWRVTPHELRPDLYPNPCDGMPSPSRSHPSPLAESGQGAKPGCANVEQGSIAERAESGGCVRQGGARKTAVGERREVV